MYNTAENFQVKQIQKDAQSLIRNTMMKHKQFAKIEYSNLKKNKWPAKQEDDRAV